MHLSLARSWVIIDVAPSGNLAALDPDFIFLTFYSGGHTIDCSVKILTPRIHRRDGGISAELFARYDEYLAVQRSGIPFSASDPRGPVIEDRVIRDAVADGNVVDLETHPMALGMRETALAGRIVSGPLPISAIGALANRQSIRFVCAEESEHTSRRRERLYNTAIGQRTGGVAGQL
jgi:hypothetical protein